MKRVIARLGLFMTPAALSPPALTSDIITTSCFQTWRQWRSEEWRGEGGIMNDHHSLGFLLREEGDVLSIKYSFFVESEYHLRTII